MNEIWLDEAMIKFNKKFHKCVLNIINGHAGCGKSTFIFKQFLTESYKYVDHLKNTKKCYKTDLNKVLYVCDTNMLKSSILEENKGITKILGKSDLKEAMKDKTFKQILDNDVGYIKVITYSTLGWLLQQSGSKHILLNYFEVILMDEMHNLFKYATRFDNEENNKPYGTVIDYLPTLTQNLLLIALSATPGRIDNGVRKLGIFQHTIFSYKELEEIRKYKEKDVSPTNSIWNELKSIALKHSVLKEENKKIMIYTNTINQSKKFKDFLQEAGYKVEWLCSINNKTINTEGELVSTMNEYQLSIRNGLLKNGTLPDDLDVIIVNGGYETGWNLRDERVQYAYIDSTDDDVHIQARNRIRHDIEYLAICVGTTSTGEVLEYVQYRETYVSGTVVKTPLLANKIEKKYIGIKLSSEDKRYLVNKYAMHWCDKTSVNWQTFKMDLEKCGFIVKSTNGGTYISEKDCEVKKDMIMTKLNKKGNTIDIIKEYKNIKLFKDKQKEISDKLIDIKVKTNNDGTLGKKIIQDIVESCGYILISRPETKGEMRKKQYWYITEILIA